MSVSPTAALVGRPFRLSITSACLCAVYELADRGGNHSARAPLPSDRRPPLVLELFFIFRARGIAAFRTRFVPVGRSGGLGETAELGEVKAGRGRSLACEAPTC